MKNMLHHPNIMDALSLSLVQNVMIVAGHNYITLNHKLMMHTLRIQSIRDNLEYSYTLTMNCFYLLSPTFAVSIDAKQIRGCLQSLEQ